MSLFVTDSLRHCSHCANCSRDGVGPNQACTLYGATSGQTRITGSAYISSGYGLESADIWRRNFLVLLGWFFVFQLTQALAIEYWPVSVYSFFRSLMLTRPLAKLWGRLSHHLCQRER